MGTNQEAEDTKRRLIEAAGEVFAEEGYHGATVRQIIARADTNLGAINYHFGDKAGLYQSVLRCACQTMSSNFFGRPPEDASVCAESRLRDFVTAMVRDALRADVPHWMPRLMQREKAAPTALYVEYIENEVCPLYRKLPAILAELLGLPIEHPRVMLHAFGVIGQINFYRYERSMVNRVDPEFFDQPDVANRLAEHITRSCLGALRATADQQAACEAGNGLPAGTSETSANFNEHQTEKVFP